MYWAKSLKNQAVSTLETQKEFIPIRSQAVSYLTQASIAPIKIQQMRLTYPNGVVLQLEDGCELEKLKLLINKEQIPC